MKKTELQNQRESQLLKYGVSVPNVSLGDLSEVEWDIVLAGAKANHKALSYQEKNKVKDKRKLIEAIGFLFSLEFSTTPPGEAVCQSIDILKKCVEDMSQ